jgi:hypothetical protein
MPGMTGTIDYAEAGPLTTLEMVGKPVLEDLPDEPVAICDLARQLVIQPTDAKKPFLNLRFGPGVG